MVCVSLLLLARARPRVLFNREYSPPVARSSALVSMTNASTLQQGLRSKCDLRACNGRVCPFEQTGHQVTWSLVPQRDEGRGMQRFLKTFKNYRELLAKERSETERMFLLKVLGRKEAENRRRSIALARNGATLQDGPRND